MSRTSVGTVGNIAGFLVTIVVASATITHALQPTQVVTFRPTVPDGLRRPGECWTDSAAVDLYASGAARLATDAA